MKKTLALAAVLALAIPLTTQRAEAQFAFIPYIGYDLDFNDLFVGVGVEFNLLPANGLPFSVALRPSAEFYFVSDLGDVDHSRLQINADAIAQLMPAPLGVFAGAGLGIHMWTLGDISSTDLGLNLLGGIEFGTGFAVPFAMVRLSTMPGTRLALAGGVRLGL